MSTTEELSSSGDTPISMSRQSSVEEVQAATKIQALYRSVSSRKQRAQSKHASMGLEQPPDREMIPTEVKDDENVKAAQAFFIVEPQTEAPPPTAAKVNPPSGAAVLAPLPVGASSGLAPTAPSTDRQSRRGSWMPPSAAMATPPTSASSSSSTLSPAIPTSRTILAPLPAVAGATQGRNISPTSPGGVGARRTLNTVTFAAEPSKPRGRSPSPSPSSLAAPGAVPAPTGSPEHAEEQRVIEKVVRIQSFVRGASLRRLLADPNLPMPQVDQRKRESWHINRRRKIAIELERSPAQTIEKTCIRHILGFLAFKEIALVATVTCREWLVAARLPKQRPKTLVLVTHESLHRVWHSTLLNHMGAIHTSLRVCVSPLALHFDLFQSYFDLLPQELNYLTDKFPNLTELVTCVKHDAVNPLVPQSPQGIHGHLYGGRTGAPSRNRRLLSPLGLSAPGAPGSLPSIHGARSSQALGSPSSQKQAALQGQQQPAQPEPVQEVRFPQSLQVLILELGLPVADATKTIKAIGGLSKLESLTLLAISELDLTPLLQCTALKSLSLRYSNLTGKSTRLRFPRGNQYSVLRKLSQLNELEIEEGFLVETVHPNAQYDVRTSFLHELLFNQFAGANSPGGTAAAAGFLQSPAQLPPIVPTSPPTTSLTPLEAPREVIHQLKLQQLHMEKTTLLRGNEVALMTLPSLTTLTPFRFSYDCNFAFLRGLPNLTTLHLHFSTSTSPPPPMLPLMSHLLTCKNLTELSFRGVAFGASEQLLLLTFLQQVKITKFRLMFCTLPSLRCIQTLAGQLTSLTLDSCVLLAMDPNNPASNQGHAPHVLFPYQDFVLGLQKMNKLQELSLNGTFETLPYATLQLLTYPSVFFPSLKKLVLTQGSVMLSSYDHRVFHGREEVSLELQEEEEDENDSDSDGGPPGLGYGRRSGKHAGRIGESNESDSDGSDDDRPPTLLSMNNNSSSARKSARKSKRHSSRPGFHLPGLRR